MSERERDRETERERERDIPIGQGFLSGDLSMSSVEYSVVSYSSLTHILVSSGCFPFGL